MGKGKNLDWTATVPFLCNNTKITKLGLVFYFGYFGLSLLQKLKHFGQYFVGGIQPFLVIVCYRDFRHFGFPLLQGFWLESVAGYPP